MRVIDAMLFRAVAMPNTPYKNWRTAAQEVRE